MPQDFKDCPIGEQKFRIGKLDAMDGSWIYTSFMKRYREHLTEQAAKALRDGTPPAETKEVEGEEPAAAPTPELLEMSREIGFLMTANFIIESATRAELKELQRVCLTAVSYYSERTGQVLALPVMMDDGRFALKTLANDGPTVLELTVNTIAFNVAPFFPEAGSSIAKTKPALADSTLQSS